MLRFEYENIVISLEYFSSKGSFPAYSVIYVRVGSGLLYQRIYNSYIDAKRDMSRIISDVFFLNTLPDLISDYSFSLVEDLPF